MWQMAEQEVMQICKRVAFMNKHVTERTNVPLINFPKLKKESLHNSEFPHVLQLNISTYTRARFIVIFYEKALQAVSKLWHLIKDT
jgi:hypothetical protein